MEKKIKGWTLDHFPTDEFPKDLSCYKWTERNSRELKDGEVRVAVTYLTVDPVSRVWISGARSYLDPIKAGDPIPSFGLGRALQSKCAKVKAGDLVGGVLSWSEEHIAQTHEINPVPIDIDNEFEFLTIYGPTGLTAYCSYDQQIKQYPKQTHIVISSAAGAVGIALVLFLKAEGYKNVYGIAGSDEKCKYVQSIGANFCLNYKTQDITAELKKRIPDGVEIFYDNVGQDVLDAVLPAMKNHSKVVMCGATATYTKWKDKIGIKNYALAIMKRIKFKGILYFHQHKKLIKAMISISGLGVKGPQAIVDGLENAPTTLRDHYFGKYIGKPLVRVRTFTPQELQKMSSQ